MKSLKEVEQNRIKYHEFPDKNTVHRSSLLVPLLEGCEAIVTLLNHFLIKRKIVDACCKITGYDNGGKKIDSITYYLTEEKVYVFEANNLFNSEVKMLQIEFFSGKNLFFPFPAVIVNHRNKFFNNFVHSYNRVLNDSDEDEQINSDHFTESAIDVVNLDGMESFFIFSTGFMNLEGEIKFQLVLDKNILSKSVEVIQSKFTNRKFMLSEIFPEIKDIRLNSGILKIKQPKQFMFFGRMLVGVQSGESFYANHSYYDSSNLKEYWPNTSPSLRQYPFFNDYKNLVRFYPIMSPSRLKIYIEIWDNSRVVKEQYIDEFLSPGEKELEIEINSIIRELSLDSDSVSSFVVKCINSDGGNPTRINHQLVYSKGNALPTSINMSLLNDNIFTPENKKGFAWGQILISKSYESILGITVNRPIEKLIDFSLTLYDSRGKIGKIDQNFFGTSSISYNNSFLCESFPGIVNGEYVWYVLESPHADIYAYSLIRNLNSNHSSGEHSF